jgi:hypothetical protein
MRNAKGQVTREYEHRELLGLRKAPVRLEKASGHVGEYSEGVPAGHRRDDLTGIREAIPEATAR